MFLILKICFNPECKRNGNFSLKHFFVHKFGYFDIKIYDFFSDCEEKAVFTGKCATLNVHFAKNCFNVLCNGLFIKSEDGKYSCVGKAACFSVASTRSDQTDVAGVLG